MKNCYLLASILLLASCNVNQKDNYARWDEYLGGADRNHFSTLNQIDTNNVKQLKVAWIYESPDTGQVQVNTIIVNGLLYGVTAGLKAYALNAETGKQIWIYKVQMVLPADSLIGRMGKINAYFILWVLT